ncbi:hypothetical protein GO485_26150 [Pseudoduganella flava]|uniref:Uncharacterized protein n=1 Tax=Pseudoduganella flava TaxID=871742 RepID=A0ABX6FZH7_9BURK|nr:hypothetical protein [Pseudoduganella flava]QGZ42181.1 hypothetical protein GO485_26150 [Pseudoduganella flava]
MPLTLRTTASGSKTIAASSTDTVTLDANRIVYDLIFVRPADLFPVQNSALMADVLSGQYPPLTVAATSPAQLSLALSFYINLLAYPTSTTATQYYAAVSNAAAKGSSASDIESSVAEFFKSTTNFKTLDLNSVVTAQTYARGFPFIWAGFTANFASFNSAITYYLYSPGTAASGSNTAAPTFQGTLAMTRNAAPPNPADPTDRSGAYQISFTPAQGAATPMTFQNGQFVSDDSDFPSVALRGTFVLKSSLTNNASDNVIVPVLSGTVNGVQVMGTTTKQDTSGGGGSDSGFWAFFHPTTFGQYLTLITTFFGLAMGLEWIGAKGKAAVDWFKGRNKPPSPDEQQQMRDQLDQQGDEVRAGQQRGLDQLGDRNAAVPDDAAMPAAQDAGRVQAADANNVARGDAQLDNFEAMGDQVEVAARYGVNQQLENVAESVRNGAQDLQGAMPPNSGSEQLQGAVEQAANNIADIKPQLSEVVSNVENELSAGDAADIKASQQVQAEAEQIAEDRAKAAEEASDGEGGEGEDPIEGGVDV